MKFLFHHGFSSSASCFSGRISMVPSSWALPRRTSSPLARIKSSMVLNLPSWVDSLNQPMWSAIKCLGEDARSAGKNRVDGLSNYSVVEALPVFASGTLQENDARLVGSFCECMCGTVPAVVCGAGKCQLEPWFSVPCCDAGAGRCCRGGGADSADWNNAENRRERV